MKCRACGGTIDPAIPSNYKPSSDSANHVWYYRCSNLSCNVAYSNASDEEKRTMIFPQRELNVPVEVRLHLNETLANSLNISNRANKCARFAFESSEDAVTWTLARYLVKTGQVSLALGLGEIEVEDFLLWGAPCPGVRGSGLEDELKGLLLGRLGERARTLTEPDLVIATAEELVFIEVKYRSGNSIEPSYPHFDRYFNAGEKFFVVSRENVREQGFEELMRNWIAGSLLAEKLGKRFSLVNLTMGNGEQSCNAFARAINQTHSRSFLHLRWSTLTERLKQPLESWYLTYLQRKGLIQTPIL